jgi:hypothetical protein
VTRTRRHFAAVPILFALAPTRRGGARFRGVPRQPRDDPRRGSSSRSPWPSRALPRHIRPSPCSERARPISQTGDDSSPRSRTTGLGQVIRDRVRPDRVLRVETVINSPKEFWLYRTRQHHDGASSVGYYPMTKGVASLVDYQDRALACNRRHLDAVAVVIDPAPAFRELRQLTEPKVVEDRSYASFNPAWRDDARLFRALLDGDHIARHFRNGDIREPLFGPPKPSSQQRRARAAVRRLNKHIHIHKLLANIPRTRRWRVTERGEHLLGAAWQLYQCSCPETSPHIAEEFT